MEHDSKHRFRNETVFFIFKTEKTGNTDPRALFLFLL